MPETQGVPPDGFEQGKRAALKYNIRRKHWVETTEVRDVYAQLKADRSVLLGASPVTSPQP
jgi:hypothetical protein